MRIKFFHDPPGMVENSESADMSAKDIQFFKRSEFTASSIEAFRQGAEGVTRDFTIERLEWPFKLEDIHAPKILVFHGEEDGGVHPKVSEYLCMIIPSCDKPRIYKGEGHSVVYYRYEEIIQALLVAWE